MDTNLMENYFEHIEPGRPAQPDFVGWSALPAITVPFEYLIGLRPEADNQTVLWDIRLTERHGVERYPLGCDTRVDFICERRSGETAPPRLTIRTNGDFTLSVRWVAKEPGKLALECTNYRRKTRCGFFISTWTARGLITWAATAITAIPAPTLTR
jgi:hypothetical protein